VNGDEWRVEVELADERSAHALADRLRSHDPDDRTQDRLGRHVVVTRDGPHVFLYCASEAQAREAERVARELAPAEATITVTRWHPDEEAWKDALIPLPATEAERAAERARLEETEEREAAAEGSFEWEVHVDAPDRGTAVALERELEDTALDVHRLWRYLVIGAPTQERANELAGDLRERLSGSARVWVQANPHELPPRARFVFVGPWQPI
jgi:hypothetical protein